MKTSELSGEELTYWVAKALGLDKTDEGWTGADYLVPTTWAPGDCGNDGAPLIGQEQIALLPTVYECKEEGRSHWVQGYEAMQEMEVVDNSIVGKNRVTGHTPLIAAMRCIVMAKYGEEAYEVAIP